MVFTLRNKTLNFLFCKLLRNKITLNLKSFYHFKQAYEYRLVNKHLVFTRAEEMDLNRGQTRYAGLCVKLTL